MIFGAECPTRQGGREWLANQAGSIQGSAAGPSRRGAAYSIRRGCRMRRSFVTLRSILPRSRSTALSTGRKVQRAIANGLSEVPDGFVFSLKGPRFAVNRRVLAEAGELDQALPAFRRLGTWRPARAAAVAIRPDQEIRRGRFRKIPGTAARHVRRPAAPPCGRGAPRQLLHSGLHKTAPTVPYPGRVRRARDLSGDRRHHRRFRLCASAEGTRKS